jgi:integrase
MQRKRTHRLMSRPRTPISSHGTIAVQEVEPGKWRARARYRSEDGKLRQVERIAPSEPKARTALRQALTVMQLAATGSLTANSSLRVLAERYLESKAGDKTAAATFAMYTRTITKNVLPRVGDLSIAEATPERLQRLLDAVTIENGPATAKSCRSVLSGMLALAVRNGAARANPVRELERIRQKRAGADALTRPELDFLLAAVRTDHRLAELDLAGVVEFMAATGCRVGEALALQWVDVDVPAGVVTLNATVVRVTGQGLIRQDHGKTESSGRTIEVAAHLRTVLAARITMDTCQASGLVFPTVLGNLRDPQNTERDWRDARKRLGLGEVRLHAFRKTVATLLDGSGLSARDIAEYLGHKNPSMTQDRYMSKTAGTARAAAFLSDIVT